MGEVDAAGVTMLQRLTMAEQGSASSSQLLGHVGVGDDQSSAAIGDDAAVEAVERLGDEWRAEDVVHGDDVP